MGGDHNQDELITACGIVKSHNLKTCLYSGFDSLENIEPRLVRYLDYLKIGHYDAFRGPLNATTTNQKMYKLENTQDSIRFLDITKVFWKGDM
jgi:hypothetical protein